MGKIEKDFLLSSLEKNKANLRHLVIPDNQISVSMAQFPKSDKLSHDQLIASLDHLNTLKIPEKNPTKISIFHSNSTPAEIMSLLKDSYRGKMNDYLQEMLNNAEIEMKIINPVSGRMNDHKELEIKIKVAATVIDKYSSLLQMIIGKKSLAKKDEHVVHEAHESLNSATAKLRRINLIFSISKLEKTIEIEMAENSTCCYSLFSRESKNYKALTSLLIDLTSNEAFSEHEFLGAVYSIREQINRITNEKEREFVKARLTDLLTSNHYPLDEHNAKEYINEFNARANILKISWPQPFSLAANNNVVMAC